jgi:hypothetical protein
MRHRFSSVAAGAQEDRCGVVSTTTAPGGQSTPKEIAMQVIKFGFGIIVLLVFGIVTTTSASAQAFLGSQKLPLLATNISKQAFVTEAGEIECENLNITSGESPEVGEETTESKVTVQYEDCVAFGFLDVTLPPFEYVFLSGGEVHLVKLVDFGSSIGCEIDVPKQLVSKVDYATNKNNLLVEPLVTGIKYTALGTTCLRTGTFANGTYKGHLELMIAHGAVSFMA